jgi:hypothetical protein
MMIVHNRCKRLNRSGQCEDRIIGAPRIKTSGRRRTTTAVAAATSNLVSATIPAATSSIMTYSTLPTTELHQLDHLPQHYHGHAAHLPPFHLELPNTIDSQPAAVSSSMNNVPAQLYGRPPPPSATAIATLAALTDPSNQPPSRLPLQLTAVAPTSSSVLDDVDAAPSSSSPSSQPSQSWQSPVTPDSTPTSSPPLSSSPSRKRARLQSSPDDWTSSTRVLSKTKLSQAWSPAVPLIIPPRMVITFDESRVIRQALLRCVPWLRHHIETNFTPEAIGHNWLQLLVQQEISIRVCPLCTSPAKYVCCPCCSYMI